MTTFRAAYIASDFGSNGAGVRLTEEADKDLSDSDLIAKGKMLAENIGAAGEVVVGDWTE